MKNAIFNNLRLIFLFIAGFFINNISNAQSPPQLGTTSGFALFTAVGQFDNIGATTNVTGDVGTNVGAFNAFPPGTLVGQIHAADPASVQAAIDVDVAYSYLSNLTCGVVIGTTLGNNQVLGPNVYCLDGASTINGDLILDGQGDANALFIIKVNGALETSTFSKVILINSASICNVFWQVNGAFSLSDNSVFRGTLIVNGAISLLEGSSLFGRGLSRGGAISLHTNLVTIALDPTASAITAGSTTTFCEGNSVVLSGNIGGTWNTGATTSSITATTSGDYFVTNTSSCGSVNSNHFIVTVNPSATASVISAGGTTTFCTGNDVVLSGNHGGTWSNGSTASSITVSTSGNYSVTNTNACGTVTSNQIVVTVETTLISSTISASGATVFCQGSSVILSGNTGGTWSTGATTTSLTVTTSGDYFVTNTNSCGSVNSNHIIVTVNLLPAGAGTISGPAIICLGQTGIVFSTPTIANATGYIWTVPSGAIITAGANTNTIMVDFSNAISGNVTVQGSNSCGTGVTSVFAVIVNTRICPGQTGVVYSVPVIADATDYVWTLPPGATITSGANTNSITVDFGSNALNGNFTVQGSNFCGLGTPSTFAVTISPLPDAAGTITGPNPLCQGQTGAVYTLPVIANATNYIWTLPTGATITAGANTNTITVSVSNTAVSGNITVQGSNDCGTGAVSPNFALTVNPNPTPSIITASGPTTFCAGSSVTLSGNNGGVWSNGAITASIIVTASGSYIVTNTNSCGTVTSNQITITVNPLPTAAGTIIGNSTVCQGQTGVVYSIPAITGATSYTWTLPAGATITSGANTNSITVNYSSNATSGIITVQGSNACGNGTISATFSVTVNATPIALPNSNSPVCLGAAMNFTTPTIAGATYLWTGPNGYSSSAQNPVILSAAASDAGIYSLTISNNGCTSAPASLTTTVINCNADIRVVKTVNNTTPLIGQNVIFTITASNIGSLIATGVTVSDTLETGYTYVSSTTTTGTYNVTTGVWNIGTMSIGASETMTITVRVNPTGIYTNTASIVANEPDDNPDDNISITETIPTDFFIPEGFSPNGDGVNDVFFIRGIFFFPNNSITIFNRWGNKVFATNAYNNTWDGKSTFGVRIGGDDLPVGTYFYLLDLGDGSQIIKGTIYLKR